MTPFIIAGDISAFSAALAERLAVVLPNAIVAFVMLAVGWALAGWAERGTGRLMERARIDPTLQGITAAVVRYGLLIVVIVAALGQLGVQITSILAVLGAIGLAIALALQGTLANIAAGIMLLWLRPFRVGDYIQAGDIAGTVKTVGLFTSELHSADGVYQSVPNSELWNKRITNYSRLERRLVDVRFLIAYSNDIETARRALLDLAQSDNRVLEDPPPSVFVDQFAENYILLGLRAWVATANHWAVRCALLEGGKARLEAAGVRIPK
ncbi:MAG TPA: mechanosensitive ion channel family protein [Hyphomicrobiaceae bacterium]|jgi:small conductance mechanosensitive channel|nr:MAG: mechanosensitive ion channel protein MscS [Pseudomonadota bacterium]HEX5599274.1 mechanosensitive ion channel family protein [Hyphomicrobiaceae bacterium]